MRMTSNGWRLFFVLAGLFLLVGGPQHPAGTMAEMLADPAWFRSHAWMLAGFVALVIGILLYMGSVPLPERMRRWARYAAIGTAVQAVEMAFHTAAMVDHANLMAGNPTPVLTTHLWLTILCYPVFALTFIGFVIAGVRDRMLGSRWFAWLGIVGAAAHGAAAVLVVLLDKAEWEFLFPLLTLCAVWMVLAGLWPLRGSVATARAKSAISV
jgi:hypothetical protein